MRQIVLVTGVSRYLGGRYAELLSHHPSIERVIGVDVVPPPHPIGRAEFVRADIRNPIIAKVIAQADVDTVVHLNVIATPLSAGSRVSMKEINVIGTMQLLAACQKAAGVRRLVVKSSAAVYGASAADPAMFSEETSARAVPRAGFGKDSVEVEGYVRGFSRRRADVDVAVLRFANIIGPGISTTMTDYFSLPLVPTVLGYDGRLQFVHEDDALGALLAATVKDGAGLVNVAGPGVLTVSQAARLAGRPTVPVPLAASGWLSQMIRRSHLVDLHPDHLQHLAFGRVLDTARMTQVLGYRPAYSTPQAFADYVAANRGPRPALLPALLRGTQTAEAWLDSRATSIAAQGDA